jgi:hypothetical protein
MRSGVVSGVLKSAVIKCMRASGLHFPLLKPTTGAVLLDNCEY